MLQLKKVNKCPICGNYKYRQSKICRDCYKKSGKYIDRECNNCGNIFKTHITHIKRGQGLYCSRSCAKQGSPTKKKEIFKFFCKMCNKTVYRRRSEINKNVNKIFFCSQECWHIFIENVNYSYLDRTTKKYYDWRNNVLDRDNYKCMLCGSIKNIHVHHIKRVADYPNLIFELKNGISLCKKCHEKTYNREKKFEFVLQLLLDLYYDNY